MSNHQLKIIKTFQIIRYSSKEARMAFAKHDNNNKTVFSTLFLRCLYCCWFVEVSIEM